MRHLRPYRCQSMSLPSFGLGLLHSVTIVAVALWHSAAVLTTYDVLHMQRPVESATLTWCCVRSPCSSLCAECSSDGQHPDAQLGTTGP